MSRSALLLVVLLLLSTAPRSAAETCLEVDVFPSPAPVGEPVVARLSGTWRDSNVPLPVEWTLEGDQVVLRLAELAGAGLPAITDFEYDAYFGPLLPGTYTLRVEVEGVPECTAGPEPFAVGGSAAGGIERPGVPPAATLLLPYFEVDLAAPEGVTTLFAVAAEGTGPVVAHVVLWSDLGIPTLAFDLPLEANEVRTVNLRDLFVQGRLPPVAAGEGFPGCVATLGLPDAERRAELVAQHTGRPHPRDGLCYGSGIAPDRATGYLTIDVAGRCATEGAIYPTQPGYFAGDDPVAAAANVLWGDYFYVEPGEGFAQGERLVGLAASPGRTVGTFYGRYPDGGADGREPLASTYLARYLRGGPFDGGTEYLVWLQEMTGEPAPRACPAGPPVCHSLQIVRRDEDGTDLGVETVSPVPALAYRQPAISLDLPVVPPPPQFGFARLVHDWDPACAAGEPFPPKPEPAPAWVTSVISADGRYSVGFAATPVD